METFKSFTGGGSTDVDRFIGQCLMGVTYTHSEHFAATGAGSYARHVALGEFYEELQKLTDTFTEVHIGISGRYVPSLTVTNEATAEKIINDIIVTADKIYSKVDTSLQSILDDVKTLCYQTLYKLTKLA